MEFKIEFHEIRYDGEEFVLPIKFEKQLSNVQKEFIEKTIMVLDKKVVILHDGVLINFEKADIDDGNLKNTVKKVIERIKEKMKEMPKSEEEKQEEERLRKIEEITEIRRKVRDMFKEEKI